MDLHIRPLDPQVETELELVAQRMRATAAAFAEDAGLVSHDGVAALALYLIIVQKAKQLFLVIGRAFGRRLCLGDVAVRQQHEIGIGVGVRIRIRARGGGDVQGDGSRV